MTPQQLFGQSSLLQGLGRNPGQMGPFAFAGLPMNPSPSPRQFGAPGAGGPFPVPGFDPMMAQMMGQQQFGAPQGAIPSRVGASIRIPMTQWWRQPAMGGRPVTGLAPMNSPPGRNWQRA